MLTCFVVFTDPGNEFVRIHRTLEGALANAVACGASSMIESGSMIFEDVARILENQYQV